MNEPEIIGRPRLYNYEFQTSLMNKWSTKEIGPSSQSISTQQHTFEHVLNGWESNSEWGKAMEKMKNGNVSKWLLYTASVVVYTQLIYHCMPISGAALSRMVETPKAYKNKE